jgi:iron complex transport system substrate-binding protein
MEKMNPGGRPYWIAHPELSSLPRCGPGGPASINKKPDMEAVLAVRPQVVFITYMDGPLAETVQNRLGIPVIVLDYGAFATFDETVFDALELAGRILNREKRAKQVVNYINALRGDLKRRTAGIAEERKPGVYVGGLGYRGAHGIGSSDHRYVPFEWLDARNLAVQVEASVGSHVSVGEETLLKLDPDVVFIDGGGLQLVETDYRKKRSFYQALRAFSSGRVYTLLPFNWYTTNIGTALADAYAIGKVLYPDRFEDIDPAQKADEIYSFLVGETVYRAMEADYGPIGGRAPFLR